MNESLNIDQLKKNCNIDGLINILQFDKDPVVRNSVIDALVEIGEPATTPLIAMLRENNDDISSIVADAVKRISDFRSEQQLIKGLKDDTIENTWFAVRGLAAIGSTESVNPLIGVLNHDNREIRITAAEALGNIADRRAVIPLISSLNDYDPTVRWFAAESLGKIGDVRSVEPLITLLKEQNNFLVMVVTEALGKIGDALAIEPLIAMLNNRFTGKIENSPDIEGRSNQESVDINYLILCRTASILTRMGFNFTLTPLITDIAKEPYSYEQKMLTPIKPIPPSMLDIIKKMVVNEDCYIWLFGIESLGKMKNQRTISFLIEILKRDNKYIRKSAMISLENCGDAAIDSLINAINSDDKKIHLPFAEILGRIGNNSAVPPLITLLDDWDPYVRDAAINALKNLMKKQSISILNKMKIAAAIAKETIS